MRAIVHTHHLEDRVLWFRCGFSGVGRSVRSCRTRLRGVGRGVRDAMFVVGHATAQRMAVEKVQMRLAKTLD